MANGSNIELSLVGKSDIWYDIRKAYLVKLQVTLLRISDLLTETSTCKMFRSRVSQGMIFIFTKSRKLKQNFILENSKKFGKEIFT